MKKSKNIFDVDLGNLHLEWARQAARYKRHAEILADAKAKVDDAKAQLDVTAAELTLAIASDPKHYDLTKANEYTIKACVVLQPEHKAAVARYNKRKHAAAIAQAAVDALEQKKKALEGEVSLFLNDYWSEPRAPKDRGEGVKAAAKAEIRKRGQVRRGG